MRSSMLALLCAGALVACSAHRQVKSQDTAFSFETPATAEPEEVTVPEAAWDSWGDAYKRAKELYALADGEKPGEMRKAMDAMVEVVDNGPTTQSRLWAREELCTMAFAAGDGAVLEHYACTSGPLAGLVGQAR